MLIKTRIILLLSMIFFISACVNKNPTTETEPGSIACKSSKSVCYKQYGKKYKVLTTSSNYSEKGVASWYGRKFNRKRTSSGERFNMYQMTAAHKTLPLSTYVQVTNLSNGKKVIVKVNDRGPFVSNRLIDVSYAAAKKLGMVGRGTVPVSIKAVSRHT